MPSVTAYPTAFASVDDPFSNLSDVGADDGTTARWQGTDKFTGRMLLTGFTGLSAIPDDATIDGVLAECELISTTNVRPAAFTNSGSGGTSLRHEDADLGDERTADWPGSSALPTSMTILSVGGTSDQWGAPLTPVIVKASTFGIGIALADEGGTETVNIDFVRLTVSYTALNQYSARLATQRLSTSRLSSHRLCLSRL